MTEKQFFVINGKHMVLENEFYKGKNRLSPSQVIDLLNDLYEENQALKSDRARYEEECRLDVFKELFEQNEQLLKQLQSILKLTKKIEDYTYDIKLIGDMGMTKKEEVTIDLNAWIKKKMSYYEDIMEKTDGYNNVNAKGHLDMLIRLKEWLEQR